MKGYKPELYCKKEIETSSKINKKVLELGMVQKTCDCKDGECKANK